MKRTSASMIFFLLYLWSTHFILCTRKGMYMHFRSVASVVWLTRNWDMISPQGKGEAELYEMHFTAHEFKYLQLYWCIVERNAKKISELSAHDCSKWIRRHLKKWLRGMGVQLSSISFCLSSTRSSVFSHYPAPLNSVSLGVLLRGTGFYLESTRHRSSIPGTKKNINKFKKIKTWRITWWNHGRREINILRC